MTSQAEKRHLSRLAALGCAVCGNEGEIHHIRTGVQGMGRKASHYDAFCLCPPHHRTGGYGVAIHAGVKEWEKRYGTQVELLGRVKQELGES